MSLRIGGCRVRISFYFFALLAAAAAMPGEGRAIAAGMLAAIVHECGHLCAVRFICRSGVDSVELSPIGMRISTGAADDGCAALPAAALSGAAANCTAAALAALAAQVIPREGIFVFCSANVCLAAINLLPADPLDGGRFLHYTLARRLLPDRAEKVCLWVSICAISALTAFGTFVLIRSRYNFSLLFLSLWLFAAVIKDYV